MKNVRFSGFVLSLFFSLLLVLAVCTDNKQPNSNPNEPFALTNESAVEIKKGIIPYTPIHLNKDLTLAAIEKVWGVPSEHADHEDIQTYVYVINGQRFVLNEDELDVIFHVGVELSITKKEIIDVMGKPTKQTGKILIYERKGKSNITFEKRNESIWQMNVYRN